MKFADYFYLLVLILSSAIVGLTYSLFFNDMSETQMVNLSFIWVFCLVYSGTGMFMKGKDHRHGIALLSGVIALTMLIAFFLILWPAL